LVAAHPLVARVRDWSSLLGSAAAPDVAENWRKHETTGRPIGSDDFVEMVETRLGRTLKPGKRGRRPARAYDNLRIVSPN
jgi:putative transposase